MYTNFKTNFAQAIIAAESVLNEYNTDIYFKNVSMGWMVAFGVFNSAQALATLHCTYDPETKKYQMEYIYYIVDFYDFPAFRELYEQDGLGIARSYELFGCCPGVCLWEKGKTGIPIPIPYY